jgi:ketosteroid isomerase-like protein
MTTLENKQLMQDIFAELAQGNSRPLVDSMADDFRWIITGNTKWSRTYDGKQVVLNELFAALRATLEGKVTTTACRFIADGDFVVVEARGNNITKSGKPYNNTYCYVFRLADGKLREMTEYLDTELVTAALGDPRAQHPGTQAS